MALVHRLAILAVIALLAGACASEDDPAATPPEATATATPTVTLEQTCTGSGFTIGYPADWHTNETGEPCRFFHHEAFTLPEDTEVLGMAVVVEMVDADIDELTQTDAEVLDRSTTKIAEAEAVRIRSRTGADAGLLPEGTLSVTYFVDLDGQTLVAAAHSTAASFDDNVDVLDAMMGSVELRESCSASELDPDRGDQESLPDEVAAARRAIVAAAVACDYDALAGLTGPGFTYSFGDDGDPAGHWRTLETEGRGPKPLRFLVELFDRPYGTTDDGSYVWPSAFTYDDWSSVPDADREALRPLYGDEDFAAWEDFGSYIGYRISITADGEWTFFVAGD